MCQAEYDGVSRVCASIERIRDDFLSAASSYERKMDSFRQEYVSLLQKSSYILTQYAEFVRKSSFVSAGGNSVGNSKAFSFIFSGAASMQYSSPKSSNKSVNQERLYELSSTNQTWVTNSDGSMVFNTPQETGQKLDSCQGKVAGFLGTCGLVSCVNVLRLAGYPATEKEVVDYASSTSAGFGLGKLCTTELFPEENGGN